jgi:hypothetical protein
VYVQTSRAGDRANALLLKNVLEVSEEAEKPGEEVNGPQIRFPAAMETCASRATPLRLTPGPFPVVYIAM